MPSDLDLSFVNGDVIDADDVKQFGVPIQNLEQGQSWFGEATKSAGMSTDDYAVTVNSGIMGYAPTLQEGLLVTFKVDAANTQPVTLNVNSLGAVPVCKSVSEDLDAGDLAADQMVAVLYDGTNFQLLSGAGATIQPEDLPSGIDAANIGAGTVSNTEFGYLDGVTSAVQTQLDAKASSSHNHAASDITSGTLALAQGGTGADLHSSGPGVLIQSSSGNNASVESQLATSRGGTGTDMSATGPGVLIQTSSGNNVGVESQLALGRGGTGADLSSSGGTGQVLKQTSVGGAITVGAISASEMPSGVDATKIGAGTVSNTEFGYLDGVTSAVQTQLDAKLDLINALTAESSPASGDLVAIYDVSASGYRKMTRSDFLGGSGSVSGSGASNKLTYWGDSSTVADTTFHYDSSSGGRLGMSGVTSPAYTIDAVSSSNVPALRLGYSTSAYGLYQAGFTLFTHNFVGVVPVWQVGGTEYMRLTSTGLALRGSAASPSRRLHLTDSNPQLRLESASNTYTDVYGTSTQVKFIPSASPFGMFLGNDTAASPVAATLQAGGGSGTNVAGASLTVAGGRGTGSAAGGALIFSTAGAGSSGSSLNALTERMKITSAGQVEIGINGTGNSSADLTIFYDASGDYTRVAPVGSSGYAFEAFRSGQRVIGLYGDGTLGGYLYLNDESGTEVCRMADGNLIVKNLGSTGSAANVYYNTTNGVFSYSSSSIRLKQKVTDLELTSECLGALRPRSWEYRHNPDQRWHSFVAEELADVHPVLADWQDGRPEGINWNAINALLVAGWQQHEDRLAEVQSRLSDLEKRTAS